MGGGSGDKRNGITRGGEKREEGETIFPWQVWKWRVEGKLETVLHLNINSKYLQTSCSDDIDGGSPMAQIWHMRSSGV
jgi:hypothetical protein